MERKRIKIVASVLVLAGLVTFSVMSYAGNLEPSSPPGPTMKTLDEVEPRVPIHASDLPLTITEPNSYYLVEDIQFADTSNHAITIECDDVTIDLMGYTLKGPDSGVRSGIYMNGCSNVEIRNGTVRDFYYGIHEDSDTGTQHRIINIRAISNLLFGILLSSHGNLVKDCTATENVASGIQAGHASTVTGNTAYDNGGDGIHAHPGSTICYNTARKNNATGIYTTTGSTIIGNTARENNGDGIKTFYGSTITANTACNNSGNGIYAAEGCTVTANTAHDNTGDGIQVHSRCRVTNNTCDHNGDGGDAAGIHLIDVGCCNYIEKNSLTYNDRGIDVDSTANYIVRNCAMGNVGGNYAIVGGNKVGSISSDPTTAGPWDNFSL